MTTVRKRKLRKNRVFGLLFVVSLVFIAFFRIADVGADELSDEVLELNFGSMTNVSQSGDDFYFDFGGVKYKVDIVTTAPEGSEPYVSYLYNKETKGLEKIKLYR